MLKDALNAPYQEVLFTVDNGPFSKIIEPASNGGTDVLKRMLLQQRLNYLNFTASDDGKPIAVDGDFNNPVIPFVEDGARALGLFEGSVKNLTHPHSKTTIDTQTANWLNAPNAPKWVEVKNTPELSVGSTQAEKWATNWTNDVLVSAAASFSSSNPLKFNGASSIRSGGNNPHSEHEAGLDADIEVDGTSNELKFTSEGHLVPGSGVSFLAIEYRSIGVVPEPIAYVAAKPPGSGKVVVWDNSPSGYGAAHPNDVGFNWDNAVKLLYVWDSFRFAHAPNEIVTNAGARENLYAIKNLIYDRIRFAEEPATIRFMARKGMIAWTASREWTRSMAKQVSTF
ncbi:MAG: hypothetical protein SGI77_21045 [Pirellulaceae bacterium]|nr:hypothetical protein [Pirellulaceae bacterium]